MLDVVYLYCNQCLTSTSKGYKKIEKTLGDAGIKIVPITNRAIIDEVLEYPIVANAFFNIPMLEKQWYAKQVKGSLDSLGVRFNRNFNVETQMDRYLDVFLANSQGAKVINTQKKEALDSIAGYQRYDKPYVEYIDKAYSIIDETPDVEEKTLSDCMNWENYMIDSFKEELAEIQADREKRSKTQFEDFENEKEYYENLREIQTLERFLAISELLHISETEQKLLNQRMVIIHGKKGMGKSQLLANLSQTCLNEGFPVVLILGGMFFDSSDLQKQLPPVLGLEYDLDMILSALERAANTANKYAVIFIDAINESGEQKIWREGIHQLYQKLDQYLHIKICISYTLGYEKMVLGDAICTKIADGEIVNIEHNGFQGEPIEATKQFLDNYDIPFCASYILQEEMTNPLFLTIFCKTYTEGNREFAIFSVFKKIIEQTDCTTQEILGYDGNQALLLKLLRTVIADNLKQKERYISASRLRKLSFWEEYGIREKKIPYISELCKAGIFSAYAREEEEFYDFGYDLMRDFITAEMILKQKKSMQNVRDFIQNDLLKIVNGKITQHGNTNVFIILCSLYAEKYHEECIDIIDQLDDSWEYHSMISDYIESFAWRRINSVRAEDFRMFVNHHPVPRDVFF